MKSKKKYNTVEMLLRIVTAIILIQTLHFKFSGHPEAVHIFSTIGMEPWGRFGVGIIELIAGVMFFLPNLWKYAALITIGIMIGALGFHLFTPIGIIVQYNGENDGGQLFGMAIIALVFSCFLLYRAGILNMYQQVFKK